MVYGRRQEYQVEPQLTFEVAGVTAEAKEGLSKRLAHATHVDWESKSNRIWEVTFDATFEDVFINWANDYDLEYVSI